MNRTEPATELPPDAVKLIASLNPLPKSKIKSEPPAETFAKEDIDNIFVIEATPSLIHELRAVTTDELKAKLQREKMVLKYKPVAQKKRPVPSVIPESVKVVRRFPSDPLEFLPKLPIQAPMFTPTARITADRMEKLGIAKHPDLRPEERRLLQYII